MNPSPVKAIVEFVKRNTRAVWLGALLSVLWFAGSAHAIVTPAPDRAFGVNAAGQDVLTLMGLEPNNPAVNQTVVRLRNLAPVDVDGDGTLDFRTWSGTLLASDWVLTCAHALQGTNGSGGGVSPGNLQVETDDGQLLAVASFTNHPGWQHEGYLLGNDLALVRLATGVAGVSNYARLHFSPLQATVGVVIAGYGEQGDGNTGGNGFPDFLATGLNTLDGVAGTPTTAGNGTQTNTFPATPASVGLMDFDQWTNRLFLCVYPPNPAINNPQTVALSAFSFMGESEASDPVLACTNSPQPEPGYFRASVCDFFPAAGDSGGPAFLWPGNLRLPDAGYFLSPGPEVVGVMSFVNTGAGATNSGVYGNVAGFTLVQPHLAWIYQAARPLAERDSDGDGQTDEAEYLAGTDPYSVPPNPADYHAAPRYGTSMNSRVTRGFELVFDEFALVGQTNEPGDQVVLALRVSVRNTGGGYHDNVLVVPDAPAPPAWPVEVLTPFLELPDLAPSGSTNSSVATTPAPLLLRCAAADVADVTNTILSGQHLHISSIELYQMCPPIAEVDAATDAAFAGYTESGNGTNHFAIVDFSTNTTLLASLAPGTLLIENPSTAGYRLRRPAPTEDPGMPLLSKVVHAEEAYSLFHEEGQQHKTEMLLVESVELTNGVVRVSGWVRQLYQVLCAGTIIRTQMDAYDGPVRDPYNPPTGDSLFTGSEWEEREEAIGGFLDDDRPRAGALADLLGFFTLHFPFNEVKFGPAITLDGEYLLRGLNIGLTVRFRNAVPSQIAWTLSTRSELDLVLTAEGGASNGGLSLVDLERQLVYAPLPPITLSVFSMPVEIQPALVVKAGCEVTAGTRVVVPIQNSVEAGCHMGWDRTRPAGKEFYYEPFHEVTPLSVSPPTLSEVLTAQATAWVEGSLELLVENFVGPYIGVRATGTFTLSPLANPWWSTDGDLDFSAGLRMRLLGLELADQGVTLANLASFLRQVPDVPTPPANPTHPLGNVEGDHVRWGRLLKDGTSKPGPGAVCRVAGTAEDVFVLLQDISGPVLARLNGTGEVLWAVSSLLWAPVQLAGTPDGGVVVAGHSGIGGVFVQKFTGAGNVVWSDTRVLRGASNEAQNPYLAKVLVRDLGGGNHEIFVVGHHDKGDHLGGTWGGGTMDTDPFLLKYDANGALLWAKEFDSVDHEVVTDAIVRRDGGLLLCGEHKLSPDGTNVPGPGALSSGWLLWAGADGSFEKARRSASALGMTWSGVTEAPDGAIYTCGQRYQTVLFTQPTLQVGRYSPDGDLLNMVTVGETIIQPPARFDYAEMGQYGGATLVQANPSPTDPNAIHTGLRDWLPDAGRTPWDVGVRLAWTPAGVVVVGNSALGPDRAPLAVCLNDNLGVRWFTCYERERSDDQFFDLVPTEDGVLVLGNSAQLYDITGATPAAISNGAALVLKLPFDGRVPLHPNSRTIQRFLQPGVHDSLADQETVGIPSPDADYLGTWPVTLTSAPQATSAGTLPNAPAPTTALVSVPIEAGNANLSMNYATWAYYHFLPPDSAAQDTDGDGLSNGAEFFFGTDPRATTASSATALTIDYTNSVVGLGFTRALAATNSPFTLLTSTNLLDWETVTNATWQSLGASNLVERLRLTLPAPQPAAFFRLQAWP